MGQNNEPLAQSQQMVRSLSKPLNNQHSWLPDVSVPSYVYKDVETKKGMSTANKLKAAYPVFELIKHPCRVLIFGRSQSGKTTLAVKLIQWLLPQVDQAIIC